MGEAFLRNYFYTFDPYSASSQRQGTAAVEEGGATSGTGTGSGVHPNQILQKILG